MPVVHDEPAGACAAAVKAAGRGAGRAEPIGRAHGGMPAMLAKPHDPRPLSASRTAPAPSRAVPGAPGRSAKPAMGCLLCLWRMMPMEAEP